MADDCTCHSSPQILGTGNQKTQKNINEKKGVVEWADQTSGSILHLGGR